jgi:hypothetical protein
MTATTLELNIDELRVLTNLLAADESRRSSPLADRVRLAFFDMDNFLNLGGMARGVGLIGPLVSCQTDRTVPTDRVRK